MAGAYLAVVGFAAVGAAFLTRTATADQGSAWGVALPVLAGVIVAVGAGWFAPFSVGHPTVDDEPARQQPVARREPVKRPSTRPMRHEGNLPGRRAS